MQEETTSTPERESGAPPVQEERRLQARHHLRPRERLGLTVVQREHPFPVRVVDVSLTGLCFRYDPHRFSIGPGDVLRVRVSKGRQAAIVVVEVRHATTPCEVSDSAFAGVRYKDLSPADHSLFQGLVKIEG